MYNAVYNRMQMVLKFASAHGQIRRRDVVDLCRISDDQATRLLSRLVKEGRLDAHGSLKARFYTPRINL